MGQKIIILENIRSAYNVGNVVRTADALGWNVWITGYTPSPIDHPKVRKTSLGAENHVGLKQFDYTSDAIKYAKEQNIKVIAAEITNEAKPLDTYTPENNNLARRCRRLGCAAKRKRICRTANRTKHNRTKGYSQEQQTRTDTD